MANFLSNMVGPICLTAPTGDLLVRARLVHDSVVAGLRELEPIWTRRSSLLSEWKSLLLSKRQPRTRAMLDQNASEMARIGVLLADMEPPVEEAEEELDSLLAELESRGVHCRWADGWLPRLAGRNNWFPKFVNQTASGDLQPRYRDVNGA